MPDRELTVLPKLIAFDLDGTLLTSDKRLSAANRGALHDMQRRGVKVAFASGRLGSSMMQYVDGFSEEIAMLTLNGAVAYAGPVGASAMVYRSTLPPVYADELIEFGRQQDFAVNYYLDEKLYAVQTEKSRPWTELYHGQTRTRYHFVDDLAQFAGQSPSKLIFVGDAARLDGLQAEFEQRWRGQVYICRTWDYYLEFLNIDADKGKALQALTGHFGFSTAEAAAFGDGENDIPMLAGCGLGIALANASSRVKATAGRVSPWSNDEDCIAREWERLVAQAG